MENPSRNLTLHSSLTPTTSSSFVLAIPTLISHFEPHPSSLILLAILLPSISTCPETQHNLSGRNEKRSPTNHMGKSSGKRRQRTGNTQLESNSKGP
uniref:Uncharacterized protein n=1 Tax=Megaselia scalaris TaxID=36166 RepID=T1GK00_MEGSC